LEYCGCITAEVGVAALAAGVHFCARGRLCEKIL
jgi:hypothetical protein